MMTTSSVTDLNVYIRQKKPLWNAIAILYTLIGYCGGLALLLLPNVWLNGLGVVLLTHSLFFSTCLVHEFIHGTIFTDMRLNAVGGNTMLWLNGGCYARFRDLTRWHIAHHVDRADFSALDLPKFMQDLPAPVRKIILALEWVYFPAIAFLVQWRALTGPFWNSKRRDERLRTTIVLLVRGSMFTLLGIVSLKALLLYFLAYVGMHLVMQPMNAFFHTYEAFRPGMQPPKRDWDYEQAYTFSTLISKRYWWLNLLFLNFGYHNAHHAVMKCPWHSLHELDRDLLSKHGQDEVQRLTILQMLGNYHRFRITRILSGHGHVKDEQGNYQLETFYGDVGVTFLVLPV